MTRLIDADALLEAIKRFDEEVELTAEDVFGFIANAPTVQREGWVSLTDEELMKLRVGCFALFEYGQKVNNTLMQINAPKE